MKVRVLVAVVAALSVLALAGCRNQADTDVEAHASANKLERSAAIESLRRNYEQARAAGLWDLALSYASQLQHTAPGSAQAKAVLATLNDTQAHADKAHDQPRLAALWSYESRLPDQGTAGIMNRASIHAGVRNDPAPVTPAQLVLLRHPTAGRSAYLVLDKGQFDCVSGCKVQVQFDDQPARPFVAKGSEQSRTTIYFDDEQTIREALDKVSVITVVARVDGHPCSLAFEVGGFDRVQFERQTR